MYILFIEASILLLSIILFYVIAFFQGKPISFWPPKIGFENSSTSEVTKIIVHHLHKEMLNKPDRVDSSSSSDAYQIPDASSAVTGNEFVSLVIDGVNLYSGPKVSNKKLFKLPAGYPLQVLGRLQGWLQVRDHANDTGYIQEDAASTTSYVIVKAEETAIRSGPSTEYNRIGFVVRDVILKRTKQKGDWLKVSHPQLTGWINKQFVWP